MRKIKTQPNLQKRILATLIDYVPFYVLVFTFIFAFGTPDAEGVFTVGGFMALLPIILWFVYFPLIESFNGQTVGHKLMGIKVVTKSGKNIHLGHALIRRCLDPFDFFTFFGLLAVLVIKNSDHHQRLGDMAAGTIVIGGETQRCSHCLEELTISPQEAINGRFDCPECGTKTEIH